MEAPKKIWLSKHMDWDDVEKQSEEDIAYFCEDVVLGLVEALEVAAYVFRVYQAHHEYKTHNEKAERNKSYAEQMEAALKALESAEIGRGME
jgi:hypothetical protein